MEALHCPKCHVFSRIVWVLLRESFWEFEHFECIDCECCFLKENGLCFSDCSAAVAFTIKMIKYIYIYSYMYLPCIYVYFDLISMETGCWQITFRFLACVDSWRLSKREGVKGGVACNRWFTLHPDLCNIHLSPIADFVPKTSHFGKKSIRCVKFQHAFNESRSLNRKPAQLFFLTQRQHQAPKAEFAQSLMVAWGLKLLGFGVDFLQ